MNQLNVSIQQSIIVLTTRGWSRRRVARELGVDRATVGRQLRRAQAEANAATNPTHGSQGDSPSNAAMNPAHGAANDPPPKPATNPAHGSRPGPTSLCQPLATEIETAVQAGLSVQRIYQDLVREHDFRGAYGSVKRFVHRLVQVHELPFRRMECEPGEEMQVDFGQGAWIAEPDRRRRRPHLFRAVLSHSRKAYSEVVWRQDTETFIRCLENAFRHFGGVTATLVVDNLKAAVLQPDWFDPELNPKLRAFCSFYGTALLPTKPAMPRHKGKIEAGVKYAQANALKGRTFGSLAEQNMFLSEWERTVADTRLHGTIRQQVGTYFTTAEQSALRPLPAALFPCFEEAPRKVHRDGHVAYQRAFYSVPPEYLGCDVWVRAEARLVRIFNQRFEPIGVHVRVEPGRFATDDAHIHAHKRVIIERGADYMLERCRLLGAHSGAWAEGLLAQRGPEAMRTLQGLLALAREHPVLELERACGRAVHLGLWRLRAVRQLLLQGEQVVQVDFLQVHPLIRDLSHYQLPYEPTPNSAP
ncbi:MAG: IS21 family transposase [Candidatus Didemnitutus sp.]|nr:IS21 family transposase [Candidatus Didemnitutus sp.]